MLGRYTTGPRCARVYQAQLETVNVALHLGVDPFVTTIYSRTGDL